MLKFQCALSEDNLLLSFLKDNGKNLEVLYADCKDDVKFGLDIIKFCPNLKKLFIGFGNNDLDTLIFNSCQYLEVLNFSITKKRFDIELQ